MSEQPTGEFAAQVTTLTRQRDELLAALRPVLRDNACNPRCSEEAGCPYCDAATVAARIREEMDGAR